MSDFECRNGHPMVSADNGRCPVCGGRPFRMDGKTGRELDLEERADRKNEDTEEES